MSALPFLELYAALFFFIRVTERWIESRHAIGKAVMAHGKNCGHIHLCFQASLQPLIKLIEGAPSCLQDLSECCTLNRHIVGQLKAMGFWHHPSVRVLLARSGGETRLVHKKARVAMLELLHHVDDETLHTNIANNSDTSNLPPLSDWVDFGGGGGDNDDGDDDGDPPGDGPPGNSVGALGFGDPNLAASIDANPLPPLFGGILHDATWRKHAVAFVRFLAKSWRLQVSANIGSNIFSIKLCSASNLKPLKDAICECMLDSDGEAEWHDLSEMFQFES
jgi:hypothetical protein